MTNRENFIHAAPPGESGSLFAGISDKELLRIRVRPAQFSRLIGASKQSVSRWIREGVILVSPIDGTLDPAQATAALLRRTPPHKMRSMMLRTAAEELQGLRAEAAKVPALAREAAALRGEVEGLRQRAVDAEGLADVLSGRVFELVEAIGAALPAIGDAPTAEALRAALGSEAGDA